MTRGARSLRLFIDTSNFLSRAFVYTSLRPAIERYIEYYRTYLTNSSNLDATQKRDALTQIALLFLGENLKRFFLFKNPAFSSEKEWRMAKMISSSDPKNVHFRAIRGTVIPYIKMEFPLLKPTGSIRLPIVEVVQGPLADPELGLKSLDLLLKKNSYDDVDVRASKIPIRF